jgi:hypothetical protein
LWSVALLIFVLVVLAPLPPAGLKVREAAARTQCIYNLKQLGLAVHNFAGTYQGALTPLTSDKSRKGSIACNGSLFFSLMPYMESEQIAGNALRTLPECTWYAPVFPNTVPPFSTDPPGTHGPPLCTSSQKFCKCPCDETVTQGMSDNQRGTQANAKPYYFPWAATSYAANYQVFGIVNSFGSPKSGNYCGPKFDIGNIPDGSSNTVFFGEQYAACGTTAGALWAYPGIGNYSGSRYASAAAGDHVPVGMDDSIVNTPESTNSKLWTAVFANSSEEHGFTAGGNAGSIFEFNRRNAGSEIGPPYAANRYWDAPPQETKARADCDKSRLQSFHAGAVIVGMGDGSARAIGGSVRQETWYSAISPADGTPLGSDW